MHTKIFEMEESVYLPIPIFLPPGTTNLCVSAADIVMSIVYKDILDVGICIPSYSNLPVTWHDRPMTRNAAPASLCSAHLSISAHRRRKPAITHDHCTLLHPLKFICREHELRYATLAGGIVGSPLIRVPMCAPVFFENVPHKENVRILRKPH